MNPVHTTLDPAIFERNLTALREFQPELVALLAGSDWNEKYEVASTRDGQLNLREKSQDRWFGRTSIPRVRAEALLQQFQSGTANVLLPGIGEGTEAELLTQRLGRHRAIYIWETDASAAAPAFCLHDFSAAIRDQRLILLLCSLEQLCQTLMDWLAEHPGHLAPDRILMWPWQTLAELAPCRTALESTYQTVEQRRKKQLAELCLHPGPPPQSGGGNVGILAVHAREDVWALADALSTGGTDLGWRPTLCDVRTPADVHPLARAKRLASAGSPDWAILLDITRRDLADVLPETVPAVSWLSTRAALDVQSVGPKDHVAVTSPWLFDRVAALGFDPARLSVIPPPYLGGTDKSVLVGADQRKARTKTDLCVPPEDEVIRDIDVAIMVDLGPTDAASFGHRLASHAQVWNTAVDLLQARIETFTDRDAENLLSRAEEKSRVRLEDAALRRNTLDALMLAVGPTLLWRFLVCSLPAQNIRVGVVGTGWADLSGVEILKMPRTWQTRRQLARRAKLVLESDPTGARTGEALLAAGAGAMVLWRQHPLDNRPGGLATLLQPSQEVVTFSSVRDLVQSVNSLLADHATRQKIAERAIDRCRSEHSPSARLQTLKADITSTSGSTRKPGLT